MGAIRGTLPDGTKFIAHAPKDYYHGDPQPPQEAGYGEFVEWQEAQFRRRRRPAKPQKETTP